MRRAGNVVKQMCDGIDASALVIVFITRRYVDKVAGDNAADNCQKEFTYSERRKTVSYFCKLHPVFWPH